MKDIGVLRRTLNSDLPLMLAWRNEPAVRANMYTQHEISAEEHHSWWARIRKRDDYEYFMYEYQNIPCGVVAFTGIDNKNANSSWAFYSSPDAVRGAGSRMEFLALEYAFETLRLNKLYCEVLAFNTSVIKLHKNFGFEVEGVFRQQFRCESEFVDIFRLGLLVTEWSSKKPALIQKLKRVTRQVG